MRNDAKRALELLQEVKRDLNTNPQSAFYALGALEEVLTYMATAHNERGAGRKPNGPEKIQRQLRFDALMAQGKGMKEIMQELGISRATYYRDLEAYKEYHELYLGTD